MGRGRETLDQGLRIKRDLHYHKDNENETLNYRVSEMELEMKLASSESHFYSSLCPICMKRINTLISTVHAKCLSVLLDKDLNRYEAVDWPRETMATL